MDNNTHICAVTADLEKRFAASQADLAAARATIAGLRRQLTLKVEAVTFTVVAAPVHPPSAFDEPTRRRRPAVIRREPITKVLDVPYVEVQP